MIGQSNSISTADRRIRAKIEKAPIKHSFRNDVIWLELMHAKKRLFPALLKHTQQQFQYFSEGLRSDFLPYAYYDLEFHRKQRM